MGEGSICKLQLLFTGFFFFVVSYLFYLFIFVGSFRGWIFRGYSETRNDRGSFTFSKRERDAEKLELWFSLAFVTLPVKKSGVCNAFHLHVVWLNKTLERVLTCATGKKKYLNLIHGFVYLHFYWMHSCYWFSWSHVNISKHDKTCFSSYYLFSVSLS